jgi:hypothetical protein
MERLEKGLQETPDNYLLRENYESLKENYDAFMSELKDEFAKN